MPYNSYDINFNTLATWFTPRWLRKQKFLIIIRACVYPFVLIHNSFINYRNAKLYQLSKNYQVCYLESFLNDRFDYTLRRIFISDAVTYPTINIYTRDETLPLYLYRRTEALPVVTYLRGEGSGGLSYDFIVNVPAGVVFQEAEMRAMIASNWCGKRYKIEII